MAYTLENPWFLLLIPLPLLLCRILPPYREFRQAVRAPWFNRLADLFGEKPIAGSSITEAKMFERVVVWVMWLLLVLSLTQPQYLEPAISRVLPTRDLLLLVDLSGSMETRDFINSKKETVDRLEAVKEVLDDFLTRREGDRVGLIVFGNAAFVQVPFTQDLSACRLLLDETAVRMAGPRTAFGDAIGLGITLFEQSEVKNRVIIALTDGNDTGSKVPPIEAAKIARNNNITIHVVGVGDPTATGEEKLDEEALTKVASLTGGRYHYAADHKQLQEIYSELDRIDIRKIEADTFRPRLDLFHWPLAVFLVVGLAYNIGLRLKRDTQKGRTDLG